MNTGKSIWFPSLFTTQYFVSCAYQPTSIKRSSSSMTQIYTGQRARPSPRRGPWRSQAESDDQCSKDLSALIEKISSTACSLSQACRLSAITDSLYGDSNNSKPSSFTAPTASFSQTVTESEVLQEIGNNLEEVMAIASSNEIQSLDDKFRADLISYIDDELSSIDMQIKQEMDRDISRLEGRSFLARTGRSVSTAPSHTQKSTADLQS